MSTRLSSWRGFAGRVRAIVRAVPRGRVVTYGQVAHLAGKPRAAREVGWIAHAGGDHIPWQRVVNRMGGLAAGYTGGREGHARALRGDGVRTGGNGRVDLGVYQWWPEPSAWRRLRLPSEAIAALTTAPARSSRSARGPRRSGAPL